MAERTNMIITIGRQYGSGGKEVGERLAAYYGIQCYDKEMVARAAKESGICEEIFETHDEKPTSSFLYSLVMDTYSLGYGGNMLSDIPINHKIFLAQFDTIKNIAKEGPCVLVGRCADYALEDWDNVVSVFIHAKLEDRINRIARTNDLSRAKAKDAIQKEDKSRRHYYSYYTNKKWSEAESYDLCLSSSALGIEGTVQAIIEYVKLRENLKIEKI